MHILFLSFFLSVHAQVSDRQKAIEEMMKEHRRIMKELLDDSLFNQEGKSLFQDFFDRMGGGQSDDKILDDIDQFFQGDQFEKFFNNQNPFSRIGSGGHWVETPQERILMVKIDIDPKTPVDIKIENGEIHINAKIKNEETLTDMNGNKRVKILESDFQFADVVPDDCDESTAKFQNDKGKIKIIFKKKNSAKGKKRSPIVPEKEGVVI